MPNENTGCPPHCCCECEICCDCEEPKPRRSAVFHAALALCEEALDESRTDKMVLVEGCRLQALNDALDVGETDELREAASGLLARMSDTYQAKNGRHMGIQGDDGEKCWIVHSDDVEELRRALAARGDQSPDVDGGERG